MHLEGVVTTEAERHFHADMVSGADTLKREIGYNPTRFMQMVGEHGGVGAARVLLSGRDASDGFTTLWEHKRLDMSVEAFAQLPWYRPLFTELEISNAERRLVEHKFDVERFVRKADESWPAWATTDST